MARKLSEEGTIIRNAIAANPKAGNKELAEELNKAHAGKYTFNAQQIANQKVAMGKATAQQGPPGFDDTETVVIATAPSPATSRPATSSPATGDVVIDPMAAARRTTSSPDNGAAKYQSAPLIDTLDDEVFDALAAAKAFVAKVGGIEKAQRLLRALADFSKC